MSRTCEQCIYWDKLQHLKDYGECNAPVPYWAQGDDITFKYMGEHCDCFRGEQDEAG